MLFEGEIVMSNLSEWVVNINKTSYKFTKSTVFKINNTLEHIKRNKKLYRYCTLFIAVCLMPSFIDVGEIIVYDLMMALSQVPTENILEVLFGLFLNIVKALAITGIILEIMRSLFSKLLNKFSS